MSHYEFTLHLDRLTASQSTALTTSLTNRKIDFAIENKKARIVVPDKSGKNTLIELLLKAQTKFATCLFSYSAFDPARRQNELGAKKQEASNNKKSARKAK